MDNIQDILEFLKYKSSRVNSKVLSYYNEVMMGRINDELIEREYSMFMNSKIKINNLMKKE